MKQNRAIPARIALLREKNSWSQVEFGRKLAEEANHLPIFSISTVSTWETGRRPLPTQYVEPLCHLCDVSKAWLLGLTDDPLKTEADVASTEDESLKMQIPWENLFKYDKQPVFVEFLNYQYVSSWGIYDALNKRIVFMDRIIAVDEALFKHANIYTKQPEYSTTIGAEGRKQLELSKVLKQEWVYIVMNSPSKEIRSIYNGWYRHNEDRSCLINAIGLTLPYSGYGISYSAYSMDESYSNISFDVTF